VDSAWGLFLQTFSEDCKMKSQCTVLLGLSSSGTCGWGGLMIANADDENDRSIRVHAATKLIFAMLMMMTTMMNNQVKYDVL
jgi:hypothetical protein